MEIEKTVSKEELILLLEELTTALKSSDPAIHFDNKRIQLANRIECEVEYEEEDGEVELDIELKWMKSDLSDRDCNVRGVYELFKGKDEQWYFHLKSGNHQIVLVSQGYHSKANALNGIESVKRNADHKQFEHRTSKMKQPYFVLKAANGEIIGCSQMYRRKAGCDKGIRSVINHAAADVVECG